MSAFEVSENHIHLMVNAGFRFAMHGSPLRWMVRKLTVQEQQKAYREGTPWGDGAIETFGDIFRELKPESAGFVGAMLWAENRRSVNHRYAEEAWEQPYIYRPLLFGIDPVAVLKAIGCYRYQSCEHPEWEESETYRFCDALEQAAICKLPGYEDAPWSIESADDLEKCRAKAA